MVGGRAAPQISFNNLLTVAEHPATSQAPLGRREWPVDVSAWGGGHPDSRVGCVLLGGRGGRGQ